MQDIGNLFIQQLNIRFMTRDFTVRINVQIALVLKAMVPVPFKIKIKS